MIIIKNAEQIKKIKKAALIWKKVKAEVIKNIKPGITTLQLDDVATKTAALYNAKMTFYKCYGFPGHICISVNHELIHGVPSNYVIKPNDLISFDIGITLDDYICDAAFSVVVEPSTNTQALHINQITSECLQKGIEQVKPGNYTGDIGHAIYQHAKLNGYEVIKPYTGHGCGIHLHEDPVIPNYGRPKTGTMLQPGMVICIEPMLMTGSDKYIVDAKNNWTVMAKNKELTCHSEAMIVVTEDGYENLTA